MGLGLYIHIPFCRSKCEYCDFYSLAGHQEYMERYQRALIRHLEEAAPQAEQSEVDTIYFGGGTPSFYSERSLLQLLKWIKKKYRVTRDAEITLEANPDSVNLKKLKTLRKGGFNRISLGMQSAEDWLLASLGRPQTQEHAPAAVKSAKRAGYVNISLDLIYGLPGQDADSWQYSLDQAVSMNPQHISAYGLKVEEGTPLAQRVAEGEVLPDDDVQAEFYLQAVSFLEQEGYKQYEISNFARPGFASRHNLKYWQLEPYMGFGPGAHSDFGGHRYSYVRDLRAYIHGILESGSVVDEDERVFTLERASEHLMLRLRTVQGIDGDQYQKEYRMHFAPLEQRLQLFESQGWARKQDGCWSLTPSGFLVSNQLIGQLIDLQQPVTLEMTLSSIRSQESRKSEPVEKRSEEM